MLLRVVIRSREDYVRLGQSMLVKFLMGPYMLIVYVYINDDTCCVFAYIHRIIASRLEKLCECGSLTRSVHALGGTYVRAACRSPTVPTLIPLILVKHST
jgi:hypothetical protein